MNTYFKKIYFKMIAQVSFFYFKNNYSIQFFNTKTQKNLQVADKSYKLRHKVYCEELKFESSSDIKKEYDQYDSNSVGCVIFLKKEKEPIATVRIIHGDSINILPALKSIKSHSEEKYEQVLDKIDKLRYGEVSRLLISNEYRNRKINNFNSNFILFLLLCSTLSLGKDLDCLIFLCERKLTKLLMKLKIPFHFLIDSGIEHRGERYLIKIDIKEVNLRIEESNNIQLKTISKFVKNLNF